MSLSLQIYRAKPNPAGKGQSSNGTPGPEQLLGEWVDIENIGSESIIFSRIELHRARFNEFCQTRGETERYWRAEGSGSFKPWQVLRVHTGRQRDKSRMSQIDHGDVDWHAYAESDQFVLNHRCGDIVMVTWEDETGRKFMDSATYAPHPPVDAILKRANHQLTTDEA
ncbi:MAG TPA: hypothetical protein VJ302_08425 [Blastocatellia bacterium]|nr:hypothetical protein [Blastocatellia bacterium]